MRSSKPDCSDAFWRKRPQTGLTAITKTFYPLRFESKNYETAPISCNFQSNPGGFLCIADCVAERQEFEPSFPFLQKGKISRVSTLRDSVFKGREPGESSIEGVFADHFSHALTPARK
jgi:hypothetical protein